MRLKTIWTLPCMTLSERLERTRELAWSRLAHRLPRSLAYYSFIDTGVRHIADHEIVPEASYMTLLERAGKDRVRG